MGSPLRELGSHDDEVQHQVTLSKGFWLSKYEITQSQWIDVMGSNPSIHAGHQRPVEGVSWYDVQDFLVNMNAKAADGAYRLPTEAQWEYAYRAGTSTRFYWGTDTDETQVPSYAWFSANSFNVHHRVGVKAANAWGLHDMAGNVYEWCQDFYGPYPDGPVTDPDGADPGSERIVRGGACLYDPNLLRAAHRGLTSPDSAYDYVGFRLVREDG